MAGKKKDHILLPALLSKRRGTSAPIVIKRSVMRRRKRSLGRLPVVTVPRLTNSHVHTTASIEEVVSDNESVGVALYSSQCERWLVDSGATHHMTPHRSDFVNYTACGGSVRVGDVATTSQVGVVLLSSTQAKE